MAVKYGFFNSVNGDRLYNADDISNFFYKLISDGVLATPSSNMQVLAGSGMTVSVSPGYGMVNAKFINLTASESVTLDAADIALPRIDRVVLRLDKENRQIVIAAKKGTPAATPSAPTLTRSDDVWELSLAKIAVASGATSITQAEITDERSNTSVCGYITGMIDQIDTTTLFAQFTAAFEHWFDGVKDEVLRNTLVRRYTNSTEATALRDRLFPVNVSEFNASLDTLNVYVNGFRLQPGVDYTLEYSEDVGEYVALTKALDVVGTPVDFEVLKSIDGSQAESVVSIVYGIQQQLGGVSLRKLTKEQYDAITTPDASTLYVITGDGSFKLAVGSIPMEQSGASVYSGFAAVYSNALAGGVGTYEEVESNGN